MFYLSIGKCQEEKASATNFHREVSLGPLEVISFVGFTSRSTFTRALIFSVAWSQRAGTESGDEKFDNDFTHWTENLLHTGEKAPQNIENQAHWLITSVSASACRRFTGKRGDKLLHLAGGLAPQRTNRLRWHVLVNGQAIVQLAGNLANNRLQAADDVGADAGEGVADEVEHRLQAGHDI
ncbi:hypothetical protein TYRP_001562 [Tyrophagus putrescentiae]|nr:hypothetical protein TYRP_001562 [Tyrophagus putrescentiae]